MTAHATDPASSARRNRPSAVSRCPAASRAARTPPGESGRGALSFAVHVPHYLAQAEWAEGRSAVPNAVVDHTGLNLPNDDLIAKAGSQHARDRGELSDNTEAAQLVQALEQQYDTFMEGAGAPEPAGDRGVGVAERRGAGAEFEQFCCNNPEA